MNKRFKNPFVIAFALAYLFSAQMVQAKSSAEAKLYSLSSSTPQLAAFVEWHRAILVDDFATYMKLSVNLKGVTVEQQKPLYTWHRKWIPKEVKITEPERLPTGTYKFYALGCTEGLRRVGLIILVQEVGSWKVLSTAWESPWNNTAKQCPI